jgi:hypothetical protein
MSKHIEILIDVARKIEHLQCFEDEFGRSGLDNLERVSALIQDLLFTHELKHARAEQVRDPLDPREAIRKIEGDV